MSSSESINGPINNASVAQKKTDQVKIHPRDALLALVHFLVAFLALLLGATAGLLQTLVRSGTFQLPANIGYYQILTLHGVLLALIFTTFFIFGFQIAGVSRTCGTLSDKQRGLGWAGFYLMLIGTIMAGAMILLNEATVLYTFYAPLKAHWVFYTGLALVVVGSWIGALGQVFRWIQWRKEHKGETTPLLSFMVVCNNMLWFVATLGVAIETVVFLIPWSLGIIDRVDVALTRTLFWYFGHALVYFWLLPAYMVWYTVVPRVIGGRMFSDGLARIAFVLFILYSIPVGVHHQLMEPGINGFWKFVQVVLTFFVIIPSFLTAFSLFATFELRGRELGGKGLLGWFKKLPWGDVRFFAPFIGMVSFIPGGIGGVINASYQMNAVIHNTIWVTGHFHLTIATTVILTFFGASYWLIPHSTGRRLTKQIHQLGIMQTWIWAIGMLIMSGTMHIIGLFGSPRRSNFSEYGGAEIAQTWIASEIAQAVGGSLLFIGILLYLIIIGKCFTAPIGFEEFPIAEVAPGAQKTPAWVENFKIWAVILAALILIAYTIPIIDILNNSPLGSVGYRMW